MHCKNCHYICDKKFTLKFDDDDAIGFACIELGRERCLLNRSDYENDRVGENI